MQVYDTPDKIRLFQLIAAKHAILLEAKGLRNSRLGRNGLKRSWAKWYGLKPRATHLEVVERLQQEIDEVGLRVAAPKQQELSL